MKCIRSGARARGTHRDDRVGMSAGDYQVTARLSGDSGVIGVDSDVVSVLGNDR
jgi:hypothetical protein